MEHPPPHPLTHRTGEIRKLLVANRGEIAVRVFRTCDQLGIATVAVAAPDDEGAFHTRRASEVQRVSGYLDAGTLVGAAQAARADAVHPGYGFLAENAEFAEAVSAAGLNWVGPPAPVLHAAGDKLESKRLAAEAGVPVVETGEPEEIGYPLMIKAAAGGGGRGMRVVRAPEELDEALAPRGAKPRAPSATTRSSASATSSARGTSRCSSSPIRLATSPRSASASARFNAGTKVLEESPSPAVDEGLRARLEEAAIAFARAAGYVGAGTAEFMLDGERFYFLELNARIQVEHPVTEAVTGIDIVEQQLRIATGGALGSAPTLEGHAVEARLYAEHPLTFLPQAGRVARLELSDDVRVDAGVEEGTRSRLPMTRSSPSSSPEGRLARRRSTAWRVRSKNRRRRRRHQSSLPPLAGRPS